MNKWKYFYTKYSTMCVLKTKRGSFVGIADLHPEDEKSKFTGSTIAALKAERAYYKNGLSNCKKELKIIKRILKDILTNCKNIDNDIKRRFYIQIKYHEKQIKDYNDLLKYIDDEIVTYLKKKDEIKKKYKKDTNN